MVVNNPDELKGLLAIGEIVGKTIVHMAQQMEPGMTTADLDAIGAAFLAQHGARSAPIKDYKYPAATCISINDEAAHAIATPKRVIKPGDLVNIDVSAEMNGFYADSGASFPVPPVTEQVQRLCDYTRRALKAALGRVRAGQPLNVIGEAVEPVARDGGYRIIKELGGHGIGRKLHEPPHSVPHHRTSTKAFRQKMVNGLVMTIEPFLTLGNGKIFTADDGWSLITKDGALSAQYEHTIVITEGTPILVTQAEGVDW